MKKQTALMNHWQLCQYLRKLHLPQVVPPPDLATLKLLQDAHLKYVPYENLDILSGRLTSLEHDDMFAKIIMKNRGGICFELNGLYNWLLESLGYKVTSYTARFIDRLEEYQIRRHRVMCIELEDKRYLTDVHPDSPLNKCKAISVFREDCNITIRGNLLKFYLGGRVKYRYTINTEYDLKGVLWEYFGIAVDYPLPNGGIDQND